MLRNTPIQCHAGFAVKREDFSCPDIPLSKMRGLYPHVAARPLGSGADRNALESKTADVEFRASVPSIVDDRKMIILNTGCRCKETSEAVRKQAAVLRGYFDTIVVPTGTGTHPRSFVAAETGALIIAHLGYSQDHKRLERFVGRAIDIIDESYDKVEMDTPFDANPYYETKTCPRSRSVGQRSSPAPLT